MAITRIQNNQITDSTIQAQSKIAAGSITGNLFAPSVTMTSNVTILGNLTLSNSSSTTYLNAINTYINDPLVVYNNGYVGSLSGFDIGMVINRNLSPLAGYGSVNSAWIWKEDDAAFEALATTDTGTGGGTGTNINNSGYANVKVGNLTAVGFNLAGAGTFSVTSNASFSSYTTLSGQTTIDGNVNGHGNIALTSTTNSYSPTTGAFVVAGGAGIGGDVWIAGNLNVQGATTTTTVQKEIILGTEVVGGTLTANSGAVATSTTTGALLVNGGAGVTGAGFFGGNLVAANSTDSTSYNTGALLSIGGLGVGANTSLGGGATIGSRRQAGYDTLIQGKNDSTLVWARSGASYDQVVIGNNASTGTLVTGAKLIINSTDAMIVPVGAQTQRPSAIGGTDVPGMLRYNTTSNQLEWYNGVWNNTGTVFTTILDNQFVSNANVGIGGNVFTLTSSVSTNGALVSINGVLQFPTLAYSIIGTQLTFTEVLPAGDVVDVRIITTTQQVTSLVSTNGSFQFQVDNAGAYVYTGSSGATTPVTYWDTTGGQVSTVANIVVSSANSPTIIDSFGISNYRTAKYIVQASISGVYESFEALVIQDGTLASVSIYSAVSTTGANLGIVSATVSGSSVQVSYTANNSNTNVRVKKDYMKI
jgi:hypothetical protein